MSTAQPRQRRGPATRKPAWRALAARQRKLTAHAVDLAERFEGLREACAILEPMIVDADVAARWGSGPAGRGFATIRQALYLHCVQTLAGIVTDADVRSPCVAKCVRALADERLRASLRERCTDPVGFDRTLHELLERWPRVQGSDALAACRRVRDKLVAHHELTSNARARGPAATAAQSQPSWAEVRSLAVDVGALVAALHVLYRDTPAGDAAADARAHETARAFWRSPSPTRESSR